MELWFVGFICFFFFRDNMLLSYSHSLSLLKVQNLTKILHWTFYMSKHLMRRIMNISFISILLMNLFYLFINEMPRNIDLSCLCIIKIFKSMIYSMHLIINYHFYIIPVVFLHIVFIFIRFSLLYIYTYHDSNFS